MRAALLTLIILSAALSGCAGDDAYSSPTEASTEPEAEPAHEAPTNVTTVANNTAPVASLTADLLNGTAPLPVNLTLDGFDADGDNLTWTLQLNGTEILNHTGNASLPFTYNVTLEPGNHTFVFALSDGNASHEANTIISVAAAIVVEDDPCDGAERCILWQDDEMEFWSDGICEAKEEIGHGAAGWSYIPWFTIAGVTVPGGAWVYEESNGRAGLQLNSAEGAAGREDCVDGDAIIF